MLKKCKTKLENNDLDHSTRVELINKFEVVFRDLKNIKKNINKDRNFIYDEEIDDLEKLLLLSSSITLRKNLKSLIDEYLKVIGNNKKILLLQIDDIDLNITYDNNIVEDIRRYLIIPNVIILISAKLNQIKSMIWQKNRKNNEHINDAEIEEMTEKYIQKIFPNTNIITMPDMLSEAQKRDITYKELAIEDYIIKIIYDKTGYKFIKPIFGLNFIIPKTLREINIFIHFLNTLGNDKIKNEQLENLNMLADYLLKIQIKGKLKIEDYNFLLSLYNNRISNCNLSIMRYLINKLIINDVSIKNNKLSILRSINDYLNKFSQKEDNKNEENKKSIIDNLEFIKEIVSNNFSEANLSLGVLLRVFEICSTYFADDYDKVMLDYTKLIYSMMLYRAQMNYLESENKFGTDLQRFIAKDIYGDFEQLYDFKKQMYKLKEKIEIEEKKDDKEYSDYTYSEIRNNLKKQDINLYKIKYLLYNLIIPVKLEDKYLYLVRECTFDTFDIPYNQKNFYYNGTLAITNIFYSNQILKFIQCEVKDNEDMKKFKKEIETDLYNIINQIPFYNIEFLISIFDKQVKLSNKTRIDGGDRCKFTIRFIEDINKSINETMSRTLTIQSKGREEKTNIFEYENDIFVKKLPIYKLLKNKEISKVINQLASSKEKKQLNRNEVIK